MALTFTTFHESMQADIERLRAFLRPLFRAHLVSPSELGRATGIESIYLLDFVREKDAVHLTPGELHRLDRFLRRNLSYADPLQGSELSCTFHHNVPFRELQAEKERAWFEEYIQEAMAKNIARHFVEQKLLHFSAHESTSLPGDPGYYGGQREIRATYHRLPRFNPGYPEALRRADDAGLSVELTGPV